MDFRTPLGLLVLVMVGLSGCSGPAGPEPADIELALPTATLRAGPAMAEELRWNGTLKAGGDACGPSNCHEFAFELRIEEETPDLVVTVAWPFEGTTWRNDQEHLVATSVHVAVRLQDPTGMVTVVPGAFYGAALRVPAAAPGSYSVQVQAMEGEMFFRAAAHLEFPQMREGDLLPDLVTMPITELAIRTPRPFFPFGLAVPDAAAAQAAALTGTHGCAMEEAAESGARRCLRFSNTVANVGAGALEVRLPMMDGFGALTGAAHYTQRIYDGQGGHRDEAVGPAQFHPGHMHFHYQGFAGNTLYHYDMDAGRGAVAREGQKLGFCFVDLGLYDVRFPGAVSPAYPLTDCVDPRNNDGWVSGMSPGWFDVYSWEVPHQYIEISGVEDGVYELVTVANVQQTLIESDSLNNEASIVFRLTGNEVEVLFRPSGEPWWTP